MKQPCTRVGLPAAQGCIEHIALAHQLFRAGGIQNDAGLQAEATAKAMRLGMLAFIRPVITSAEGRWVAITRCMPAARPIWATRQMDSSTSLAATSIRSASSSMTTTMLGHLLHAPRCCAASWL